MRSVLTCLGTGDGVTGVDRNHSAYVYSFGETNVLLDCGEPVNRTLKASGWAVDAIDSLVISHLHSDHFAGLFMLLQGFWLDKRQKPLTIYLPADAITPIRQMLQIAYLYPERLPFRLHFLPLQPQQTFLVGPVRITPFRTSHLDRARETFAAENPGDYLACCFLLEADGLRVGHSADLGAPEDLEPLLAQPLDLLVCELAHFEPGVMFQFLKGREIRRILFTHVARYYWENLPDVQRQAEEILAGRDFSFARDGESLKL